MIASSLALITVATASPMFPCWPAVRSNAQFVRERNKIATGVAISLGKLGFKLSYAGSGLGHAQFAFTDPEFRRLVPGLYQRGPEVRYS